MLRRLTIVAGLLVLPVVSAMPQACTYSKLSAPTTAANPRAVASSDLNGDAILDLITANLDANSISVLLGNGDGTFGTAVNYPVGSNPYQVVVADFNGDGKPDVATADFGGTDVSVLLGNGDGTFRSSVMYTTGTKPRALVATDLNADGHLDLAAANSTASSVSVLLGLGDGTFHGKLDYSAGGTPHGIVVADFNGDGKPDLAVANNSPNGTVSILPGNGNGGFGRATSFSVGASPYGLATGDFNGDGFADLVTANFGGSGLSVLLGKGDGTFGSATTYATQGDPVAVRVADINGDGVLDLLAADFGAGSLDLFLGNGDGTFGTVASIVSLSGAYDVAVGDFDRDGTLDLAVATSGTGQVTVLKGACPAVRPSIRPGGVVNAANGAPGIAPGAWTSIYGSNLASASYALTAGDLINGYLPTSLRGTSIQIDGKAAFVYYVSPTQINVLAPDGSASDAVAVQVSTAAGTSAAAGTVLQPILPGLFAASNYVLAVRVSDGAILNAASPARPGDVVELYGTGFGPTSPAMPAGLVFSGAYATTNAAGVTIGSTSTTVLWSGQVGAGLYQINLVVPTTLADGDYDVVTTIGGVASQSTPLINIRSH